MKKIFAVIMTVFLLTSTPISAVSATIEVVTVSNPDRIAAEQIKEFVRSSDPIVTWTEETLVSRRISLYDFEGEISGYIYYLETVGKPTGFIQLNLKDNSFVPFSIGFDGADHLTSLLENTEMSAMVRANSPIYYVGGLNYYVATEENRIVDLLNDEIIDCSIAELNREYEEYVQTKLAFEISEDEMAEMQANAVARAETKNQRGLSRSAMTTTVYNYFAGAMSYRNTRYYQINYDSTLLNHCAPTAVTNMVLYWSVARGHSDLGTGAIGIFEYMYDEMGTSNNGTPYANVFGPIQDYFELYDPDSSLVSALWSGVTFNRIKDAIDDDIPVQLEIGDWSQSLGHSINVWGYNTGGTNDYYYVTTNLNTNGENPTYTLLNIDDYEDYRQFEYVGYRE